MHKSSAANISHRSFTLHQICREICARINIIIVLDSTSALSEERMLLDLVSFVLIEEAGLGELIKLIVSHDLATTIATVVFVEVGAVVGYYEVVLAADVLSFVSFEHS